MLRKLSWSAMTLLAIGVGAYAAVAWLCWVPNLLIVDWFVLKRAQ